MGGRTSRGFKVFFGNQLPAFPNAFIQDELTQAREVIAALLGYGSLCPALVMHWVWYATETTMAG